MAVEISKIDTIIARHSTGQQGLISSLLDIQDEYRHLPPEAMRRVSERMDIPIIRVFQVVEFYKVFSMEPRGEHIITVCLGTACHVRGGELLIDQIGRVLGIGTDETSPDFKFTLEAVNCLGCCALGPVMVVDSKYYGNMTVSKVERVLNTYLKQEATVNA